MSRGPNRAMRSPGAGPGVGTHHHPQPGELSCQSSLPECCGAGGSSPGCLCATWDTNPTQRARGAFPSPQAALPVHHHQPPGQGGGLGDMPLQRGAGRVSPNSGESRLGTQRAFFAVFHSVPTLLNVSRFGGETFGRFSLRLGLQAGLPRALLTAKKDNQPPSPPSGQQSHF